MNRYRNPLFPNGGYSQSSTSSARLSYFAGRRYDVLRRWQNGHLPRVCPRPPPSRRLPRVASSVAEIPPQT